MPKTKLLQREAKLRARGLLDMLYTPGELADELGINSRHVAQRLIPAGLPTVTDSTGQILIHGPEAVCWIGELSKKRQPLGQGEAYCLRCRVAVLMATPQQVKFNGVTLLKGDCPKCGARVNRGVKAK